MTEQQISAALDELVSLVSQGKNAEAFEKFYDVKNLEKTDFITGKTYKGKAENDKANETLVSKITAFRELSAVGKVVKGNRSFLVWSMDIDHADKGTIKTVEVAVQDWNDGKIIREQFVA
jgi:hypothetical protein